MQEKKKKSFSVKENTFKSVQAERFINEVQGLIDTEKARNYTQIAKKAGFVSQDFTDIKSGKKDLQRDFLDAVGRLYKIDVRYVLTGEKDLHSGENNADLSQKANKKSFENSESNNNVADHGTDYVVKEIYEPVGTPIYNVLPHAHDPDLKSGDAKIIGYLSVPGTDEKSFALPVHGNSMKPALCSGDIGVLRPISDTSDIEWGNIYHLKYGDYKVWKRLLKDETSPGEVILWSDNQHDKVLDQPKYAAKSIRIDRIDRLCLLTDILKKPIA